MRRPRQIDGSGATGIEPLDPDRSLQLIGVRCALYHCGVAIHSELPGEAGRLWDDIRSDDETTARRAARQLIAAYHSEQLSRLLEHVRTGFQRLDAGEIDAFELDELIHRYHRCAQKLWSFCGSSGGQWLQAARNLAYYKDKGEEPDWWAAGAPRGRQ